MQLTRVPPAHAARHHATLAWLLALMVCTACPAATAANSAETGRVLYVRGTASAQGDTGLRLVANGATLYPGDTLVTASNSFAVLQLADDTRITLRPDTRFQVQGLDEDAGKMDLRLLSGGLRAQTGRIARMAPDAFTLTSGDQQVHATDADFVARACKNDCAAEKDDMAGSQTPYSNTIARAVVVTGKATARDQDGMERRLFRGAPISVGDLVITAPRSHVVLAYRDDTRVTVQPDSRFETTAWEQAPDHPEAESALFRLRSGGFRSSTGAIAKRRQASVRFSTPLAVLGIRGTGFDAVPADACAGQSPPSGDPALVTHVWEGAVLLEESNALVQKGETACLLERGAPVIPLANPPQLATPRPDEVDVPANLFGTVDMGGTGEGLQISVIDGQVVVADPGLAGSSSGTDLFLGPGEDGFASADATPMRVNNEISVGRADLFLRLDAQSTPATWDDFDPGFNSSCPAP